MSDSPSDRLEDMLEDGSLIVTGVSDQGEIMYMFSDKCKELHPEVWQNSWRSFLDDIDELCLLGFIDIEVGAESGLDNIIVNDKTFVDDPDLPPHLRWTLVAVRDSALSDGVDGG